MSGRSVTTHLQFLFPPTPAWFAEPFSSLWTSPEPSGTQRPQSVFIGAVMRERYHVEINRVRGPRDCLARVDRGRLVGSKCRDRASARSGVVYLNTLIAVVKGLASMLLLYAERQC